MARAAAFLRRGEGPSDSLDQAAKDVVAGFDGLWSASEHPETRCSPAPRDSGIRMKPSEAVQILDVVKRGCGPASKDLLSRLTPLLSKLLSSSVQVPSPTRTASLLVWQSKLQQAPASLGSARIGYQK